MPLFQTIWDATGGMAQPVSKSDTDADISELPGSKMGKAATRIISALIMIPPVLACVHFGFPYFNILVAVMVALMAWEWWRLVNDKKSGAEAVVFAVFLVGASVAGSISEPFVALILFCVISILITAKFLKKPDSRVFWMISGVFYVGLPTLALLWVRGDGDDGRTMVYWLLALVWAADTGAYVAGRLIGGPKLAPRISPNKTWAGMAGCIFSAALVGGVVSWYLDSGNALTLVVISGLIGMISQGGDLAESAVKRHFGVKDSSHLIPGHGGILDRVDALLPAILIVALIKLVYGGNIIQWP